MSNDEDIPVIKSRQASLGVHYQLNHLLVSLEGYYKKVDGIITSSQGFQNQFRYVRSGGSYDIRGLDFLIKREFGDISAWISYSHAWNRYTFEELYPSEFPSNLDIRHIFGLGSSYQADQLQISGGIKWHSGIPYTAPSGSEPVTENGIKYQEPNNLRLDNYIRLDLSAKYWFHLYQGRSRMILGASLLNISDHQNIINIYYVLNEQGEPEPVKRYSLGFTPNLMCRIEF